MTNNSLQFKFRSNLTLDTVKLEQNRLLLSLKKMPVANLELDLSEVSKCDSAGLALLIEAKRLCNEKKLNFSFCSIPKEVYSLAQFCGVESILANAYL